eukprot:7200174-Prymnesium_polylepis.1
MDGRTDRRTDGRTDRRTDGRTDGAEGVDRVSAKNQNRGSDLHFSPNSICRMSCLPRGLVLGKPPCE